LRAARKMYPDRCISASDSSGSTSINAMSWRICGLILQPRDILYRSKNGGRRQ
jgi:hypothetical protein